VATSEDRPGTPRAITELLHTFRAVAAAADEGLRERKKRLMRQQISDTATMLFLERGFDAVKVSDVAAACDVSEKTVYNYFPTKESLLFDRTDHVAEQIRESLRDRRDGRPLAWAAHDVLVADFDDLHGFWVHAGDETVLSFMRRFGELVERTPSLQAAQRDMFERLVDVAAAALAERAGVSPDDPEPQMAALAVVGIWRVQFGAMRRHVVDVSTVAELREAVLADVLRATRIAEAGLSSFDAAIARAGARQGLRDAAEAMNDARRQVVAAVRQASEAWRQVADHLHEDVPGARARHEGKLHAQRLRQDAEREAQAKRMEAQRARQAKRHGGR
jgi:AcrR family transcriptional regulator